jgi:SWI/SNF chromatin-remodeling complex subunit SWI1
MFNLDPSSAAAKQMAALNAASMLRNASRSIAPSSHSASGVNSAPFLGGITSINTTIPPLSTGQETANPGPISGPLNFQSSSNHPSNQPNHSVFSEPTMSQTNPASRNMAQGPPNNAAMAAKLRQKGFLVGLANVMSSRGTPLPPHLTGVPYPAGYDPTNSPWKALEPSQTETGSFRLAGKDVNLFKLWGLVFQSGGGTKMTEQNAWNLILPHFGLPEHFPVPFNGQTSVASTLAYFYMAILHPFEEAYKRNMHDQQRRAQMASQQPGAQPQSTSVGVIGQGRPSMTGVNGGSPSSFSGQVQGGGVGNMLGMNGHNGAAAPLPTTNGVSHNPSIHHPPQTPLRPPSTAQSVHYSDHGTPQPSIASSAETGQIHLNGLSGQMSEKNVLDQEVPGMKRKLESEEADNKRARQRTSGSEPPEGGSLANSVNSNSNQQTGSSILSSTPAATPAPRINPTRRKVTYLPVNREVETYGGRDLNLIEEEFARSRRPLREIHDWGVVDIDSLMMSIRSGLATELSYAITTFTLLSTMRGQTQGSGFPISQCIDLLDEVLDLLEDEAFGGEKDDFDVSSHKDRRVATHRELLNLIQEQESGLFACLQPRQGSKAPERGPLQRPGNIVLAVMNILRNLSTISDNLPTLATHPRLLDVVLRVCELAEPKPNSPLRPASSALSLTDIVTLRKDALYILTSVAGMVHFHSSDSPSLATQRIAIRAFQLVSSFLIDSTEAVSPTAVMHLTGSPLTGYPKPPLVVDIALEVFTKLSHVDSNRQVFSKSVSQSSIWRLFEALVHRLPVADGDFQLATREAWLSYLEKTIMAIYSLAFLSPPELKEKVKSDRKLGFSRVMLRMIQKFLLSPNPESRMWFIICAKRAIEAMKVIDDTEDSFDAPKSTAPIIAFGMGYGEVGESGIEKGTGLWGGHRDVTWDLLLLREITVDETMFAELDALARVE